MSVNKYSNAEEYWPSNQKQHRKDRRDIKKKMRDKRFDDWEDDNANTKRSKRGHY